MTFIMDTLVNMDTTLLLSTAITVLTFVVIYYQIKTFTFWSSRGIKGPIPLPFLGTNIYFFFRNRVELDQEWRNKYGQTYGIYEGHIPVLVTSNSELIKHINIKNFSSFTDRNSIPIHTKLLKNSIFFSPFEYWSNQRALITPMFTGNKMKSMFQTMEICVDKFMKEVKTRQAAAAIKVAGSEEYYKMMDEVDQSKAQVKAALEKTNFSKDETMGLTLDVISRCFFSLNMDTYKDKTSEFFKRAFAFATFDIGHFILWALTPAFITRTFRISPTPDYKFEYFDKLSMKMIKERKSKPGKRAQADMLQNLIEATIPDEHQNVYTAEDNQEAHYNDQMSLDELEAIQKGLVKESKKFRKFSDEEIAGQTVFFFIAGFETTSSSLSFCLYEFGHQQELQEEVYNELMESISGPITYDSLMKLKKLEAFISEALRLYNPITQNTRMVTAKEGATLPTSPPLHLPKGCVIAFSGLVCHREPMYWEEPLKFDMTRFYPENKHKIQSGTYHPFGIGPRNCAGMRFALLQIRLLLATLLLKYKVLPGVNNLKYPPSYKRHGFFLQLANTDFRLVPRDLAAPLK